MQQRIRVHAHPRYAPSCVVGSDRDYPVKRTWQVYADGEPTGLYVVDSLYRTVVDAQGVMQTSWHAGIAPGNLARLIAPRYFATSEA